MKFSKLIGLTMIAITSIFLFACGGGGGGGSSTPALTADKMTGNTPVLNGASTTLTFDFGVANAGKTVTFSASPAATLTPTTTTLDSSGKASVVVSAAPSNVTVNVTASIAGYIGTKAVQFIQQPDKVVVSVATTKTIADLYTLAFGLRNQLGANFPYASAAFTSNYSSFSTTNSPPIAPATNDVYFLGVFIFGFNITPSVNILDMTFGPGLVTGIPYFEVFQALNNPQDLSFARYTKVNPDPALDTPSVTTYLATTDFVITTKYYLGTTLLATK